MTNREAIRAMFREGFAVRVNVRNMEPQPDIFPGYPAPIVRNTERS